MEDRIVIYYSMLLYNIGDICYAQNNSRHVVGSQSRPVRNWRMAFEANADVVRILTAARMRTLEHGEQRVRWIV